MRRLLLALVVLLVVAAVVPAHAFASCIAVNPGIPSCSFPTFAGAPVGFYLAAGTGAWSVSLTSSGVIASGTGPGFGPMPCPASDTTTASATSSVTFLMIVCAP